MGYGLSGLFTAQAANGLDPNRVEWFGFASGFWLDEGKWVLRTYSLVWIGFRVQTVWIGMVRSLTRSSHKEPDSKNKISRSHYKILSKLTEIGWRWLSMTGSYSVQSSVARTTRGLHIKSRTLKLKPRVHTIKFYRNWLKFFGDDSVWLAAIMCKTV